MSLLLAAALQLAPAPAAETPRAFVERLYAGYGREDYDPLADPAQVFAPPLVEAIAEDSRLSRDEVGYMDGDPLCQCQDAGGLIPFVREVRPAGRSAATARVELRFPGPDRRDVRLKLVRTPGGWRIADVAAADEPSLLGALRRFNRRRAAR